MLHRSTTPFKNWRAWRFTHARFIFQVIIITKKQYGLSANMPTCFFSCRLTTEWKTYISAICNIKEAIRVPRAYLRRAGERKKGRKETRTNSLLKQKRRIWKRSQGASWPCVVPHRHLEPMSCLGPWLATHPGFKKQGLEVLWRHSFSASRCTEVAPFLCGSGCVWFIAGPPACCSFWPTSSWAPAVAYSPWVRTQRSYCLYF